MVIVNGIVLKNRNMDSKFTCIRSQGSSQLDIALCNNIELVRYFQINNKLPSSDHCPYFVDILVYLFPSISIINDSACGFKNYNHYDTSESIKNPINIKRQALNYLEYELNRFVGGILDKYSNLDMAHGLNNDFSLDKFSNELSNGVYDCYMYSNSRYIQCRREPTQNNCNSQNFMGIADVHYKRYLDLLDSNYLAVSHHKEEWLFYQGIYWQKEEEELNKFNNEKWSLLSKSDPKKLWKQLEWRGEVRPQSTQTNIIRSYIDNIFNDSKIQGNPKIEEVKDELESYDVYNDVTDKKKLISLNYYALLDI